MVGIPDAIVVSSPGAEIVVQDVTPGRQERKMNDEEGSIRSRSLSPTRDFISDPSESEGEGEKERGRGRERGKGRKVEGGQGEGKEESSGVETSSGVEGSGEEVDLVKVVKKMVRNKKDKTSPKR